MSDGVAQSVAFAFKVLETVADEQPIGVSAIARILDRSKTTVQRSLASLESAGYVFKSGNPAQWRMTLRALSIGMKAEAAGALREIALPEMQRLLEATEESIHLNVLDGREMVVVEKLDSRHAVAAYTRLGERLQPHASATGKAVLAHLPSERVDDILPERLTSFTPTTITEKRALKKQLAQIRELGYSVNDGERRADVIAIGSAIFDANGRPVGGLAVAAPRHRVPQQRVAEIANEVMKSAEVVTARLNGERIRAR